jgi:hypothetical protein
LEEAEPRFARLAELQPDQPTIKKMLAETRAQLAAKRDAPEAVLKRKLSSIIIAECNFREARAEDAMDYLVKQAKEEINIVWQVPADVPTTPVTLRLRNTPPLDVLGYVTQAAGVRSRVDAHAIVIYRPTQVPAANAKSE